MWETKKDNGRENKKILIIFFIIVDFIFYYLLTLNIVLYKRNKKYLI